ncbi:MAG: RNA polymerase sigma factor [Sediminibacterium sp.]
MTEKDYNESVLLYADNVYRFIVKNLRHTEDAEDIVQSAFEKLWIHKDSVETAKAKSYLFTVAYHLLIDHTRKAKRISLQESFENDTQTAYQENKDLKKVLHDALATLSETQRSLVLLKDNEGYSYEEIGEITKLTIDQVRVYLHRARLKLRNYLISPQQVL